MKREKINFHQKLVRISTLLVSVCLNYKAMNFEKEIGFMVRINL